MRRKKRRKRRTFEKPVPIELAPARMAGLVDVHQAAKMLELSTARVYELARRKLLPAYWVRKMAVCRRTHNAATPHPWVLAEQRRLAELAGWKRVPAITVRLHHRNSKSPASGRARARWLFHLEDVHSLKEKRASAKRREVARRVRVRVLGKEARKLRLERVRLPRAFRKRVVRLSASGNTSTPLTADISRLLTWKPPCSL